MPSKQIVYGLGGVWLVLFVASFVMLQLGGQEGDSAAARLSRVAAFLSWQGAALVAATILAWVARRAVERGLPKVKLVGYLPLVMSVFIVVSFIAIVAYRVFVVPLLA
jgi:hypothetical protein